MTNHNLAGGIARLEAISAAFDYEKVLQYTQLAKAFLRNPKTTLRRRAFSDVCDGLDFTLPQDVNNRLNAFLRMKPDYPPTTRDVCEWYLRELHAMDLNLKREEPSVYEPLIKLLELGGSFYEHHGDLCIQDAATVMIQKTTSQSPLKPE